MQTAPSPETGVLDWLKQQIFLDTLAGRSVMREAEDSEDVVSTAPVTLLQHQFGAMWPQSVREVFTTEDPPDDFRKVLDTGEIDTDRYLGIYLPSLREVRIFVRAIDHFAGVLRVDRSTLEAVVRLHEYAHAIVHLGANTVPSCAEQFLCTRSRFRDAVEDDTHELLAQLIAWSILDDAERHVFLTLMQRQSQKYRLTDAERQSTPDDVRFILALMRRTLLQDAEGARLGVRSNLKEVIRARVAGEV